MFGPQIFCDIWVSAHYCSLFFSFWWNPEGGEDNVVIEWVFLVWEAADPSILNVLSEFVDSAVNSIDVFRCWDWITVLRVILFVIVIFDLIDAGGGERRSYFGIFF